ncbi:YrdB family protein [Actinosynnema sp. NPDC051121]|nr:YrdB family protein [Saccharothrix sp.]
MTSEPVTRLRGIAGVVLTVRFLTELALLAGLAVASAHFGDGPLLSVAFAVLLPATAAVIWGRFIAPRARRRLPEPSRFLVEVALFAATALALSEWPIAAVALAVSGIGVAALTRAVAKDG